jgi:magnesium-transporting ATPase (P-type)
MMDESSITGESDYIQKSPAESGNKGSPFIVSGSKVMDGSGKILVTCVGEMTVIG